MLEGEVRIINQLGLHARAAAQLVKLSACYASCLTLRRPDTSAEANAKSMLDILTLAAPVNSVLLLFAEGEDEAAAFESIRELFASGFGEI
ncbi:MAG: HPr family phosphocarrier protein [Acidobacteria bacterium]|nr:HPr family phosphocarrier protein [Acidobacteriota bacterium]